MLILFAFLAGFDASAAESAKRQFDLPAGAAEQALKRFSLQAGVEVVFATSATDGVRTAGVKGEYAPLDALDRLLRGTPLEARPDERTGAIVVSRGSPPSPNAGRAAPPTTSDRPRQNREAAQPDENRVVELSPFEVNASNDVGYLARNTLAGTRMNTALRDVASQVSIMNAEFLQDVAAIDLQDALRYSLNTENLSEFYDVTNSNQAVYTNNPWDGTSRSRGLGTATSTHDFFPAVLPIDTYNTERFTFVYGPNAILCGSGNPAGNTDTTFKRPQMTKRSGAVALRVDSRDSWRTTLDFNQPLWRDKVALRVDALWQDQRAARKPNFDRAERLFGTLQIDPIKRVRVRGWYENLDEKRSPVRNMLVTDAVTPWIQAGRPIFDNGVGRPLPASSNVPTAANYSPVFLPYANSNRPVAILGQATSVQPGTRWNSNTVVTRTFSQIRSGSDSFDTTLADDRVFPLDINVNGGALQNRTSGFDRGFTVELNPLRNFYIEGGLNDEYQDLRYIDFLDYGNTDLRVDANKYLPDRVTPNPNVGRYYFQGNGLSGRAWKHQWGNRVQASYEYDFTERKDRWRWLGRHRVAGMLLHDENRTSGQRTDTRIINNTSFTNGTAATNYNDNTRNVAFRYYVDDPQDPSSHGVYGVTLPFDPFAPTFTVPGTDWEVGAINNHVGAAMAPSIHWSKDDATVFAMQNFFWDGRIATTYGKRRDSAGVWSIPNTKVGRTVPVGPGVTPAFYFDHDPRVIDENLNPDNWTLTGTRELRTELKGIVVHPFPWLSLSYNQSNSQNPAALGTKNLDGSLKETNDGVGKDYGITFSLWRDTIYLRLNRYTTSQLQAPSIYRAFTGIGGINAFRDKIYTIEKSVLDAGAPSSTKFAAYTDDLRSLGPGSQANTFREVYDVTSDTKSAGYEAELIANPLPNWRVAITAAQVEASEANIAQDWFEFIRERAPIWLQYRSAPVYNRPTQTVGGNLIDANTISSWNFIKEQEGRRNPQSRKYRFNFTTRYTLRETLLRGLFVGGNVQWRSRTELGYGTRTLSPGEGEFQFPGLVTGPLAVIDRTQPIFGPDIRTFEGFVGYSRHLWKNRIHWQLQLNVRNLFANTKRIPQRILSDASVAVFTLPEPRTFILTNTFSF